MFKSCEGSDDRATDQDLHIGPPERARYSRRAWPTRSTTTGAAPGAPAAARAAAPRSRRTSATASSAAPGAARCRRRSPRASALRAGTSRPRRGEEPRGRPIRRRSPPRAPASCPRPRVAAVAVMGMLAFGVLLGSATSQLAQSAGLSSIVLEVAPSPPPPKPVEATALAPAAGAEAAPLPLPATTSQRPARAGAGRRTGARSGPRTEEPPT